MGRPDARARAAALPRGRGWASFSRAVGAGGVLEPGPLWEPRRGWGLGSGFCVNSLGLPHSSVPWGVT